MDDLPKLPFEQLLSYLSLEDRLKARAVSRVWRNKFDRYPVKFLFYSRRSSDSILGKNRWVNGAFTENFISSTRFATFFDTFGETILSNLKHLRLCEIDLSERDQTAFTLNSFDQLEQLDIIRVRLNKPDVLNLNLPMLLSFQLEGVKGISNLTLEAPRLRGVKILDCYRTNLRVEIVHGESVERLLVDNWECTEVKKLKNLQYLYVKSLPVVDSTFLSGLDQLKEIHTNDPHDGHWKLFEQKQRSGRVDLNIYLCGLLLNGRDDSAINALYDSDLNYLTEELLVCLAENRSRLADEIPFYRSIYYAVFEDVPSGLDVDLLKRFTDLNEVTAYRSVQDTQSSLDLLKNCDIVELQFECDQPQDLFDRLPEHCAVQWLSLSYPPSDLAFLFRLKHLIELYLDWSIDSKTVRRAFQELPALYLFSFRYDQKRASIDIEIPKEIQVSVDDEQKTFNNLNAAIEFIFENQ